MKEKAKQATKLIFNNKNRTEDEVIVDVEELKAERTAQEMVVL